MAGKIVSGKFHNHDKPLDLLSTFRTALLRTGPLVRNAENSREVQAEGEYRSNDIFLPSTFQKTSAAVWTPSPRTIAKRGITM